MRQETLYAADGSPITSRDRARERAKEKSEALSKERGRIAAGARPVDRDSGWQDLKKKHEERLLAGGSSPKSLIAYNQTWRHFDNWGGAPSTPSDLTASDLHAFLTYLRGYTSKKTGAPLSKHSVATHARHFRAVLNFGRRTLHCVRLDSESLGDGLKVGRLPRMLPESYDTTQLCAILRAARCYDLEHPKSQVFPLIAFLMIVGCRIGEAETLRWVQTMDRASHEGWVDLEGGNILLYGHKTQIERAVPLDVRPLLTRMLKGMKRRVDVKVEPYVFGGPMSLAVADKRRTKTPSTVVGRSLKTAIEAVKNGVDFHWSPHTLRKNLATYLANSSHGRKLHTLADELGHDYQILLKHYVGRRKLTAGQESAPTVEEVLGIAKEMSSGR